MPSLYEQLKAAGCEIDSHESDLYVKDGPGVREMVKAAGLRSETFRHAVTGAAWIDVPFAFDPWWAARAPRT